MCRHHQQQYCPRQKKVASGTISNYWSKQHLGFKFGYGIQIGQITFTIFHTAQTSYSHRFRLNSISKWQWRQLAGCYQLNDMLLKVCTYPFMCISSYYIVPNYSTRSKRYEKSLAFPQTCEHVLLHSLTHYFPPRQNVKRILQIHRKVKFNKLNQ